MKLDLNCDLGEGEPLARTRALMRFITSANVACGGHAGDVATMEISVRLSKQFGVHLGAHPGPWSRSDFGRVSGNVTPDELELLLLQQVGALEKIARRHGVRLHHVKLHGALYHASENHPDLARRYLKVCQQWWPGCVIYARAGGSVVARSFRAGIKVWPEVFADRAYNADGTLVPRHETGAIINDIGMVLDRVRLLKNSGELDIGSGQRLQLTARTICLHSDTEQAPALARHIRRTLERTR
jgi:UPF0271 protein